MGRIEGRLDRRCCVVAFGMRDSRTCSRQRQAGGGCPTAFSPHADEPAAVDIGSVHVDIAKAERPVHVFISYRHQEPDTALAHRIADTLKRAGHGVFIDTGIRWGANWESDAGHDRNFSRFLDDAVFGQHDAPLLVSMDEVDRVFKSPIKSEFFASVRAFYNRGAMDSSWKRVRWLLSTSSEPSFFIDDLSQSPFNIGLRVDLSTFTPGEVETFARRHGLTLDRETLEKIMEFVGGRPYLVHRILYEMVRNPRSADQLFDGATAAAHMFRDHLHRYRIQFQQAKDLATAMNRIISGKGYDDARLVDRLEAAGLIQRDPAQNGKPVPLCRLYAEFFGNELKYESR